MVNLRELLLFGALAAAVSLPGTAALAQETEDAFRVCADPNNLPFSNKEGEGFENELARLWAERLGKKLEYTWFPQRRGFERMTLRSQNQYGTGYKCDVILGVAAGWELGLTTKPYYRSTWAIAYLEGGKLDGIETIAELDALPDEEKAELAAATFIGTPASHWLSIHGLDSKLRPYPALDADPARYPGMLIEQDLLQGDADFVILWGPVAGYFANKVSEENEGVEVKVLPIPSEGRLRFDYSIAAGVRYGEGERRDMLQQLIDDTREDIDRLLEKYGFPIVAEGGQPLS
jgi:quinoprotein dehydrogenase-associated probable ABC transporter substrate-binding protein